MFIVVNDQKFSVKPRAKSETIYSSPVTPKENNKWMYIWIISIIATFLYYMFVLYK
jgi:hypothetical protein